MDEGQREDLKNATGPAQAMQMQQQQEPGIGAKPHYMRQFFAFNHLAPELREVSEPFAHLAQLIDMALPENPEKSTAFRKLLEAKDCAVRARLFKK